MSFSSACHRQSVKSALIAPFAAALLTLGCADGRDKDGAEATRAVEATFDQTTGRLQEIRYDSNNNDKTDTWTYMDGARVLRIEIDKDEDGKIDRWEYYRADRSLEKVGFSSRNDGKVDAWAFEGPDGRMARMETDTNRDGKPDKWDVYRGDRVVSTALDDDSDGRADRRLLYDEAGALLAIESQPDLSGTFTSRTTVASEGTTTVRAR